MSITNRGKKNQLTQKCPKIPHFGIKMWSRAPKSGSLWKLSAMISNGVREKALLIRKSDGFLRDFFKVASYLPHRNGEWKIFENFADDVIAWKFQVGCWLPHDSLMIRTVELRPNSWHRGVLRACFNFWGSSVHRLVHAVRIITGLHDLWLSR